MKIMKKRLSLLAVSFILLAGPSLLHAKSPEHPSLRILNHHDNEKIHGKKIRLILKVSPSPDQHHPIHLHIYVNGRMATMITINSPRKVVTLHHLPKGKDVISFVQANPMTHKEMGNDMAGMDMSDEDMGDMGGESHKTEGMKSDKTAIQKTITVLVQ
ncbi:MAG: hypothetical protein ACYCT9_01870 [Leptospirillum sp.]